MNRSLRSYLSIGIFVLAGLSAAHADPSAELIAKLDTKVQELSRFKADPDAMTDASAAAIKRSLDVLDAGIELAKDKGKPNALLVQKIVELTMSLVLRSPGHDASEALYELEKAQPLAVGNEIKKLKTTFRNRLRRELAAVANAEKDQSQDSEDRD